MATARASAPPVAASRVTVCRSIARTAGTEPGGKNAAANAAACLIGLYLSYFHDLPYGPTLILALGAFFAAALVVRAALPQS